MIRARSTTLQLRYDAATDPVGQSLNIDGWAYASPDTTPLAVTPAATISVYKDTPSIPVKPSAPN